MCYHAGVHGTVLSAAPEGCRERAAHCAVGKYYVQAFQHAIEKRHYLTGNIDEHLISAAQ
jgi:hypothetical protein